MNSAEEPSSSAIKHNTDFMNALRKFGVKDATSQTHPYFQLQISRFSVFNQRMASLIRRCASVDNAVNALNHAILENIPETKVLRGLLPLASDAHLASKRVDEDKAAAFRPVAAAELKKLERHMAGRVTAVFSAKHGEYLYFRIEEGGSLVGYTTQLGIPAYPGEEELGVQLEDIEMMDRRTVDLQNNVAGALECGVDDDHGSEDVADGQETRINSAVPIEYDVSNPWREMEAVGNGTGEGKKEKGKKKKKNMLQPIDRSGAPTIVPVGHWDTEIFLNSDQGLCSLKPDGGPIFPEEFLGNEDRGSKGQ